MSVVGCHLRRLHYRVSQSPVNLSTNNRLTPCTLLRQEMNQKVPGAKNGRDFLPRRRWKQRARRPAPRRPLEKTQSAAQGLRIRKPSPLQPVVVIELVDNGQVGNQQVPGHFPRRFEQEVRPNPLHGVGRYRGAAVEDTRIPSLDASERAPPRPVPKQSACQGRVRGPNVGDVYVGTDLHHRQGRLVRSRLSCASHVPPQRVASRLLDHDERRKRVRSRG